MAGLGLVFGFTASATELPGEALVRLRKRAGLSQRALAAKMGVSAPTIIALELKFSGSIPVLLRYLSAVRSKGLLRDPSKPRRRLIPQKNDPSRDIVMTPDALAQQVVDVFAPQMSGTVLEPAAGEGAFLRAFPERLDSKWCEITKGRNFFGYRERVDWIVTNPPFSEIRAFLGHALEITDNIVFVIPLAHLTTKARLRLIAEAGFAVCKIVLLPHPKSWPSSGFQLAAIHLRRGWLGACRFETLDQSLASDIEADVADVEAELLAAQ